MGRKSPERDPEENSLGAHSNKNPERLGSHQTHIAQLSQSVKLTVNGLPPSLSSDKVSRIYAVMLKSLLSQRAQKDLYRQGEQIYQGRGKVRIGSDVREFSFVLEATRVITALEVYKNAYDFINLKMLEGEYDEELAELAAEFIKRSAWNEMQSIQHYPKQEVSGQEIPLLDKSDNDDPVAPDTK